ncbi:uncharacterized protein LOC117176815 isoform X2 [Belonocnema kinseyi]|uniref:uncharacterized protein LOC117176815 isoform X2 n=1 Tax=Belonocnema kinseyi TaxID=2817044 RepID=UPI00143D2479|nr:uncharacterized protein LOC117176815 isoform X2 [Belonocnema kinseyi]
MVSKRVKYARSHLSRRKHITLLARPHWRRLQKRNVNELENPFTVKRAALKFRPTKRIRIMAQPKVVKKKYDPAKDMSPYPRIPPQVLLSAKSRNRLQDLSLPQKRENLRKELKRALNKPGDWERHEKVLERIAKPVARPPPPTSILQNFDKKRIYDPKKVDQLAQPVVRRFSPMRDPFKVHPGALKYEITDKIKNLAFREHPREYITPRIPGEVKKFALKFIDNERYTFLATPLVRPPGKETDLKDNAFDVAPAALKAWCSPRLKILAKPKSYRK